MQSFRRTGVLHAPAAAPAVCNERGDTRTEGEKNSRIGTAAATKTHRARGDRAMLQTCHAPGPEDTQRGGRPAPSAMNQVDATKRRKAEELMSIGGSGVGGTPGKGFVRTENQQKSTNAEDIPRRWTSCGEGVMNSGGEPLARLIVFTSTCINLLHMPVIFRGGRKNMGASRPPITCWDLMVF